MIIPQTIEDWSLYYQDSFIRLHIKEKPKWVYVHQFRTVNNGITVTYSDSTQGHSKTFRLDLEKINFDLSYPDCHYYFYNGESKFLTRIPQRQATKGISRHNSRWLNPLFGILPGNFRYMEIFGTDQMLEYLNTNQSDFPLSEAMRMTSAHRALTVPVKREWCVSLSPNERFEHLLWYRLVPVAYMKHDVITVGNSIFKQEIIDTFQNEVRDIRDM